MYIVQTTETKVPWYFEDIDWRLKPYPGFDVTGTLNFNEAFFFEHQEDAYDLINEIEEGLFQPCEVRKVGFKSGRLVLT